MIQSGAILYHQVGAANMDQDFWLDVCDKLVHIGHRCDFISYSSLPVRGDNLRLLFFRNIKPTTEIGVRIRIRIELSNVDICYIPQSPLHEPGAWKLLSRMQLADPEFFEKVKSAFNELRK